MSPTPSPEMTRPAPARNCRAQAASPNPGMRRARVLTIRAWSRPAIRAPRQSPARRGWCPEWRPARRTQRELPLVRDDASKLQRQPGLPDASGPDQRDEARSRVGEPAPQRLQVRVTANESRRVDRCLRARRACADELANVSRRQRTKIARPFPLVYRKINGGI